MSAFPQPFESTVSHWQATNRGPTSLWNHGRDAALPTATVDYVIIGGGITGASLAYQLTRAGAAGDGKTVVLLEAKDVASGATGRNGGHIAPASWKSFPNLVASIEAGGAGLTAEEALDVLQNELDTLDYAVELAAAENLDVDLWHGHKLEVKVTPGGVAANERARDAYLAAKAASPKHRDAPTWTYEADPAEAKKLSRSPLALACNRGRAGSCHPHRFATALLRKALASTASDFNLFSWAPVQSITREGEWLVDCGPRGQVRARNVVLCVNAHARHLWRPFESHVVPFRGHAALVTPPRSMAGAAALTHSYSIERGTYLMSTPHAGIVMGVYNVSALSEGVATKAEVFGVDDDSVVLPAFRDFMAEYGRKTYAGWDGEAAGEGLQRIWSGIMAASRDHLPLIGRVPGGDGLWCALAFHGHGMARILTSTRGLAHLMATGDWDPRLPRCFEVTSDRLERAKRGPEIITDEERLAGGLGRASLREDVVPAA